MKIGGAITLSLCLTVHSFTPQPINKRSTRLFGLGIGIDLGTTFSAVAYLVDDIPQIIEFPGGARTIPSVVSHDLQRIGYDANEESTAYRNVKRVIGTGGKIQVKAVPHLIVSQEGKTYKKMNLANQLHDAEHFPTLLRDAEGNTMLPKRVSQRLLEEIVRNAERHTGETVDRAVIGIPAYFNDAQRQATIEAAETAGIGKVKLLREPEAAALAYGIGKEESGFDEDELVLVFDLGGGTFDVSMLVVGGGLTEIISTSGDAQLGGSNFDQRIADHFAAVWQSHGINSKQWNEKAQTNIVLAAEIARIHLSNQKWANLVLPNDEETWTTMTDPSSILSTNTEITDEKGILMDDTIHLRLTRKKMEALCKDEFQALLRPVREVAIMSGAMLPGDSSPTMVEAALELEENLGVEFPDFYEDDLKAAKKAQQKGRKKSRDLAKKERKFRAEKRKIDEAKVQDGISGRPISRVVLVGGATRMLAIGRILEALTGVKPQKTVNPDEAVALGCGVHVGVLDGGERTVLNPMQAAILRALAEKQGISVPSDDDDDDFGTIEYL